MTKKFTKEDVAEVTYRVAFSEMLRESTRRNKELRAARSELARAGQYPASFEQAVITAESVGYKKGTKGWITALSRLTKCHPMQIRAIMHEKKIKELENKRPKGAPSDDDVGAFLLSLDDKDE